MAKRGVVEVLKISEAFGELNLKSLRPPATLISPDALTRKTELLTYLSRAMLREDMVHRLDSRRSINGALAQPLVQQDGRAAGRRKYPSRCRFWRTDFRGMGPTHDPSTSQ